ncbi:hypothetical protein [Sphingobacterium corticibacter]|uniref:Uncharacterized protein n=1 Tax=Sphingobacterium corticibacter TaxID=2171749 RepID=A0A2T8HFU1_9SPHI|nr:hypothetical protein [Sphingobacterium corticibacter]PVH24273.1 hypothetical protein DC487_14400 [Sphingobacterium corticibacter]
MKISIESIDVNSLTEQELPIYKQLDASKFGVSLAKKVADKLFLTAERAAGNGVSSRGLYHAHRDYCGVGLYFIDSEYTIGEVYDGMGPYPKIATFQSEEEFVEFMSSQSDQSMSLFTRSSFNNQTITRLRLTCFLEDDYSTSWNSFAEYLQKSREG